MHIALASRWYPPHTGNGGVAAYTYYLAHALAELGHRVSVVAARWSADVPAYQHDRGVAVHRLLAVHRARLHRLPLLGRHMRAVDQLRYSARVDQALRQIAARDRLDVVEFPEVNAEGFVYLRRRQRAPVVVRCHTPTFILRHYATAAEAPYSISAIVAMEKQSIRRADALTAPSHDMAQTIARECGLAPGRIQVIPNGLDVASFTPQAERSAGEDRVTILHVGRLERVKGVGVLAQAIPALAAQAPQARVVFVGEGGMRGQLESCLQAQGVRDQVTFTGSVDPATLAAWYRQADIAAVPSLNYESFSYTCAQAMAAGLPVVATSMGGMPETVADGGMIVPPSDTDALVTALCTLVREPELRLALGQRARQRAHTHFSAAVVAEQTASVYQRELRQR